MDIVSIPAHFDGQRIVLDEPVQLEPDTRLIVTVLPTNDTEQKEWALLSARKLQDAYEPDEEEYSLDSLKVVNLHYEGR